MILRKRPARSGFTLTEILVVVSIIGILAALITTFLFGAADRRRVANTELALQTITKMLQHHWSQVIADAKKEDIKDCTAVQTLADGNMERAKIIWVKLRLMEAFPTRYDEVNNTLTANQGKGSPDTVNTTLNTYIPKNRRKFSSLTISKGGKPSTTQAYNKALVDPSSPDGLLHSGNGKSDPFAESAACLYMALSAISRGGQQLSADTLPQAVADSDGDGAKEFVDSWAQASPPAPPEYPSEPAPTNPGKQQPLRFYRFAWGNEIQKTVPSGSTGAIDPIDNKGLLLNPLWYNKNHMTLGPLGPAYVQVTRCAITGSPAAPSTAPLYIIPVVVSAGADNWFGLQHDLINAGTLGQLNSTMTAGSNDDNIYNFKLRNQ
jgi:prepilin-type N-terminal cleavage/methylation domain-containing protein